MQSSSLPLGTLSIIPKSLLQNLSFVFSSSLLPQPLSSCCTSLSSSRFSLCASLLCRVLHSVSNTPHARWIPRSFMPSSRLSSCVYESSLHGRTGVYGRRFERIWPQCERTHMSVGRRVLFWRRIMSFKLYDSRCRSIRGLWTHGGWTRWSTSEGVGRGISKSSSRRRWMLRTSACYL